MERERGKGYGIEAARVCLDFGFTRTSRDSIRSIVSPLNTASCVVAARIHSARREFMKGGSQPCSSIRLAAIGRHPE
jgi:RimJ/RimL family protein N-acetyltransferase